MKLAIYYYSGAGNTECIAKIIQKLSMSYAHDVIINRITLESVNLNLLERDYDILGLGYPVHFRKAPSLVIEFIERCQGINKKIFTFCTKGMYSGNASREILLIAQRNGFTPVGNLEIYMPGTDALILFAKKGSLLEKILKSIHSTRIREKIDKFLTSVFEQKNLGLPKIKWYTFLDYLIVRKIEKMLTNDYQIFKDMFIVKKSKCNLCKTCIKNCPNLNIDLVDNCIVFLSNCSFCLRCIHRCPTEAIQLRGKTEKKVRYFPVVTKEFYLIDTKTNTRIA